MDVIHIVALRLLKLQNVSVAVPGIVMYLSLSALACKLCLLGCMQ